MSAVSELMSTGIYERMVQVIGNMRGRNGKPIVGEIGPSQSSYIQTMVKLRQELGLQGQKIVAAYYEIADEARKAVNAARRLDMGDPNAKIPAKTGLPCPDAPDERCDGSIQVTGFIDVTDPTTGVRQRVPFVFRTDDRLTSSEVATRAAQVALSTFSQRGYDKGGQIDPATATTGTVVVTGINARA